MLPGPSPWALWGCSPGLAQFGPWPAMGVPALSLPLPQVGLDGAGWSHSCDEANRISQPKGDVLQGPGGQGAAGSDLQQLPSTSNAQGSAGWVPCSQVGLHHSPVQNHHHHGAIGAQESRVLQVHLLGLFGGNEPHALGALRDELTAWA